MIFAFIGILVFEALTNWRVPIVVNRIRFGMLPNQQSATAGNSIITDFRFSFEAERLLRIIVALILIYALIINPDSLGVFPWIIAVLLLMAGITKICPLVISFRFIGFR